MKRPMTTFAIDDPYLYNSGFSNYQVTEAIPRAIPVVNNSPQRPPLGLFTERISGGSFVGPREYSYHAWLYRLNSSLVHTDFEPLEETTEGYGPASETRIDNVTPNSCFWSSVPVPAQAHWANGQQLLGRTGEPLKKEGMAIWLFSVTQDMPEKHTFCSLDGDTLIVPQSGALDVQTEMGRLLVRQNEIAVIPRSVRCRVTLPEGKPARGYVCELYQGHFRLPDLGVIGSTGLANHRDFEIPLAHVDAEVHSQVKDRASAAPQAEWTNTARLGGKLWRCTQPATPFDVAAWHGTCYPYKYDLGRFCAFGNVSFDENDPSLFTVLTARNHGAEPSTSVVDFAVVPPRWKTSADTLWVPYYHRNTMHEFYAPIVAVQDPEHPLNSCGAQFGPFAAGLHGCMATHGPRTEEMRRAMERDTSKPELVGDEGVVVMLMETDRALVLSDWAAKCALLNVQRRVGKL